MCDHPVCDVELAGEAVQPLREVFHMFLQSVADVMMYLNPGSPLQVCGMSRAAATVGRALI